MKHTYLRFHPPTGGRCAASIFVFFRLLLSSKTRIAAQRVALFTTLTLTGFGRGQTGEELQILPTGTEAMRALINEQEFKPWSSVRNAFRFPHQTLIIVLGDHSAGDSPLAFQDQDAWIRYFRLGGALLIASDHPTTPEQGRVDWSRLFGVRIEDQIVQMPSDEDGYKKQPNSRYFPFVRVSNPFERFTDRMPGSPRELFRRFDRLATNKPKLIHTLYPRNLSTQPGAWFPLRALKPNDRGELVTVNPLDDYFAVGGPIQRNGQLLVMGDHSVFINSMILQEDNQNLEFTSACLQYLKGPSGFRDRCLFVEDGRIVTDFDLQLAELPTPPLPPLPVLVNMIGQYGNTIVAELEDQNFFNDRLLRGTSTQRLLKILLVILTLGLIVWAMGRLWRARAQRDPLLKVGRPPEIDPMTSHFIARRQALAQTDNWNEVARRQIHDWFLSLGGQPDAEGHPPPVRINASFWRRRHLRREINELWQFAFDSSPGSLTDKGWMALRARLIDLGRAAEKGEWQFER